MTDTDQRRVAAQAERDATIRNALDRLRTVGSASTDSRIRRMEKALVDHERLGSCIYGDECRALTEAREATATAVIS